MARRAFIRWFRGLLPTFIMLFLVASAGVLVWLSVWGLPDKVRLLVERELHALGVDVRMSNLRISIWNGMVLEGRDVTILNVIAENQPPIVAEMLRFDINMDALLTGHFQLDRIDIVNGEAALPLVNDSGNQVNELVLEQLNASIGFGDGGMIEIREAGAILQGMRVNLDGMIFPSEGDDPLSSEQIQLVLKRIDQAVTILNNIQWPVDAPPVWNVRLTSNQRQPEPRVIIEMEVPMLDYKGVQVRDIIVEAEYAGDILLVKKFLCREAHGRGKLNCAAQIDIAKRSIHAGILSEVPLFRWTNQILGYRVMPDQIRLKSVPSLRVESTVTFDENWESIGDIDIRGAASIGEFEINGQNFNKFFARFSYSKPKDASFENGKIYLSNIDLSQGNRKLEGQIMSVDRVVQIEIRNTLPAENIFHLVKSFYSEGIELPDGFEIRGTPDILITGQLDFTQGWGVRPRVPKARTILQLDDFSILNVDMGSITLSAEMNNDKWVIHRCVVRNDDRHLDFKGEYEGDNIYFSCFSNLRPATLNHLLDGSETLREKLNIPEQLKLPVNADFHANGMISIDQTGAIQLQRVNMSLHTDRWAWKGVDFNGLDLELKLHNRSIEYVTFSIIRDNRHLDIFAHGNTDGEIVFIGQSTVRLDLFDHILGMEDDNFFFERFSYTDDSQFDISFNGIANLDNPLDTYSIDAEISAGRAYYKGVLIDSARSSVKIESDIVTMIKPSLVIDNTPYINERKIERGAEKGTLEADQIILDFNTDLAHITTLHANAFPDYALRMFSESASRALSQFRYASNVAVTGSGVFPMGDDLKDMKASLSFRVGNHPVNYDFLGTTMQFYNARGSVSIGPKFATLSNLEGNLWGGRVSSNLSIQIDGGDSIRGNVEARGMNLAEIGKSYDTKMNPASMEVNIAFNTPDGGVNKLTGQGSVYLRNGDLVEIPIFGKLALVLKNIPVIGDLIVYNIRQAECEFIFNRGQAIATKFEARGTNLELSDIPGSPSSININNKQVNAVMQLQLKGISGLLSAPISWFVPGLLRVTGKGPLDDVNWSYAPFARNRQQRRR